MRLASIVCLAAAGSLLATPLAAACDTANEFRFSFASQAAQGLAYQSSYGYIAVNGRGDAQTFTVALAENGLSSTVVGGQIMPRISNLISGPTVQNSLMLGGTFTGRTADITSATRIIRATFTFPQAVRDISITLFDMDFNNNQFRDWVHVSGSDAGGNSFTPAMVSPAGNGNGAGQPTTAVGSSVRFQQTGTAARQATGNANSGNNSNTGTINISFAQPVTSVTISYGNAPLQSGESGTGPQAIGISGVAYCPMPLVTVSKTSAPTGGAGSFNLPGEEVIYTLTVTNSGGSPVDAASLSLTDLLPPQIDFRNAPFDGTTALPVKLVAGAGASLTASGVTYQQRGGAAYTYTPAAGYDPQIGGLRVVPQGELGANATLTLQFRARIR